MRLLQFASLVSIRRPAPTQPKPLVVTQPKAPTQPKPRTRNDSFLLSLRGTEWLRALAKQTNLLAVAFPHLTLNNQIRNKPTFLLSFQTNKASRIF